MVISGSSMSPFLIHARDSVWLKKPNRPLKVGDIVFYQRESGQYVLHRICKIKSDGYYMIGDAQTQIEGPLKREQIFAQIGKVERKGKILKPGDFWWNFFEKVWIRMIPVRVIVTRIYAIIYRNK